MAQNDAIPPHLLDVRFVKVNSIVWYESGRSVFCCSFCTNAAPAYAGS